MRFLQCWNILWKFVGDIIIGGVTDGRFLINFLYFLRLFSWVYCIYLMNRFTFYSVFINILLFWSFCHHYGWVWYIINYSILFINFFIWILSLYWMVWLVLSLVVLIRTLSLLIIFIIILIIMIIYRRLIILIHSFLCWIVIFKFGYC